MHIIFHNMYKLTSYWYGSNPTQKITTTTIALEIHHIVLYLIEKSHLLHTPTHTPFYHICNIDWSNSDISYNKYCNMNVCMHVCTFVYWICFSNVEYIYEPYK